MKISIVIADGYKQIMMTPESDYEKEALKYIEPDDTLNVASMKGTYDTKNEHFSYNTGMCQGNYLRRFAEEESLMFVISKKDKADPSQTGL